ncbi:hypothetical protein OG562_14610 [Streptomyces sp. NBC_01275]|uniref:hypothetical protein n=1 Tax=Streptomyces sp. NBC_01275 TaxID=2903807 RepID=UPI00224E556A|nr:hypothetical protein [Streptomyces sp. NBC_01275]MCX4762184.1 hypothetical protein [Streptomyces sp. NBC_01275]
MPGQDHETTPETPEAPEGGYHGMDALMAAILDVPLSELSEEARADPAYLAARRSARTDVALLRAQLGVVADALTGEPAAEPAARPAPAPVVRLRPPRGRLRPFALRAVGVAAAGALVLGGGWVVVQVGRGAADISSDKSAASGAGDEKASSTAAAGGDGALLGDPGYLACARLVVEGDVTEVARVPGTTRERVTLHVTRAYKPAKSAAEVDFEMERDMDPLVGEGDHVLVGFAKGAAVPDVWAVGETDIAAERTAMDQALPESADVACE